MEVEHRDRESRQRDIEFSNKFRSESIKHLISVASGVFVFTVAFTKDMVQVKLSEAHGVVLMKIGWVALVISIVGGVWNLRYWAWFFSSWGRAHSPEDEKEWRAEIDNRRKMADQLQVWFFCFGLLLICAFAVLNL